MSLSRFIVKSYDCPIIRDVSVNDFGLVIAYLLPGFSLVWGSALATGAIGWDSLMKDGPTIGGFLFTTVVALAAGMTLSILRWLLIDPLHHASGIRRSKRDFGKLSKHVEAYAFLNDAHYRYYQYAAGMLLATCVVYAVWRWRNPFQPVGGADLAALALALIYYLGSRDSLRKFYERTGRLLSRSAPTSKSVRHQMLERNAKGTR